MLETWTWQIPFSLLGGLIGFLVVLVPVLLIQYVRYGRLSPARLLATAALAVYAVALVAYTLLPLPDAVVCSDGGAGVQAVPLATLADISRFVTAEGISSTTTIATIAQPILNIALFVPLGVLVRAMAGRGIAAATLTGFAVSLLIELTQFTGIYGLYDCAYRVADIDDVLTNTAGALLGALIAPLVAGWIPRPATLAALPPQPVTRLRRLLGMALDGVLITLLPSLLFTAVVLAWAGIRSLTAGSAEIPDAARMHSLVPSLFVVLGALLSIVLPALQGSGASPGQRLVGIVPVWDGRRGTAAQRLARALAVAGTWALVPEVASLLGDAGIPLLPFVLQLAVHALALATIAIVLFVDRRGLSGTISGAELVDHRAARDPAHRRGPAAAARPRGAWDRGNPVTQEPPR